MNKKSIIYILSAMVWLMVSSCAVTDIDRTANFNHYKTFAWGESDINVKNPVYSSSLINRNIKATVENEFAARGIQLDNKQPDFIVSYHTYTEQKQQYNNNGYYGYSPFFSPFMFYRFGWWGMPYGMYNSGPRAYTYTEGTLIVDITDTKTNELIWRGTVKGNVDSISNLEKQIHKGVKAIMKKYPVTPQPAQPLIKDEKVIS
jgi:hypothetical protein